MISETQSSGQLLFFFLPMALNISCGVPLKKLLCFPLPLPLPVAATLLTLPIDPDSLTFACFLLDPGVSPFPLRLLPLLPPLAERAIFSLTDSKLACCIAACEGVTDFILAEASVDGIVGKGPLGST